MSPKTAQINFASINLRSTVVLVEEYVTVTSDVEAMTDCATARWSLSDAVAVALAANFKRLMSISDGEFKLYWRIRRPTQTHLIQIRKKNIYWSLPSASAQLLSVSLVFSSSPTVCFVWRLKNERTGAFWSFALNC